jgi:hypothetical protein
MNCTWLSPPKQRADGIYLHECKRCHQKAPSRWSSSANLRSDCRVRLTGGPGTELTTIFKSLGIAPAASCGCQSKADQMDAWGIAGCRVNRPQIIGWMTAAYDTTSWLTRAKAACAAGANGLACKLDWSDPIGSLVDEAIRRAEARGKPPAGG